MIPIYLNLFFISISLVCIIFGTSFLVNAFGEIEYFYEKDDVGGELTQKECEERIKVMGTHYEPDKHLAKLKVENHPVFKELTKDDAYSLISTGVRSSIFSEICDDDLPFFEFHYSTNSTDDSYTRIYTILDRISYDVGEIRIKQIEGKEPERHTTQPLMLNARNWQEIQIVGEYTGADPPIPSQAFRFPYLVNNGKINEISGSMGEIKIDLSSRENAHAIFALKIPRNYPYTDHDDEAAGHPGHGLDMEIFSDSGEGFPPNITKLDCFYEVWFPFSGNHTNTLLFRWSFLQVGWSFHGDPDVPEYCAGYSLVDEKFQDLLKLSPLKQMQSGVKVFEIICKDDLTLVMKSQKSACVKEETARKLWDRGWVDKSADIYSKNVDEKLLEEFQSKLIDDSKAKRIVENFIKTTNLEFTPEITEEVTITTDLSYSLLTKGYLSLLDVNYDTGLPDSILPPWWEGYYRTPSWYTELQKDYLGIENHRIDDGDLYWKVSYRTCLDCIADYPIFFVDPIEGKVKRTHNLDAMFIPAYT